MKFQSEFKHFHSRKCTWKCRLRNGVHLSRPQCVKTHLPQPEPHICVSELGRRRFRKWLVAKLFPEPMSTYGQLDQTSLKFVRTNIHEHTSWNNSQMEANVAWTNVDPDLSRLSRKELKSYCDTMLLVFVFLGSWNRWGPVDRNPLHSHPPGAVQN